MIYNGSDQDYITRGYKDTPGGEMGGIKRQEVRQRVEHRQHVELEYFHILLYKKSIYVDQS